MSGRAGMALLALPGAAVWLVDALAVCLLLGAFCARFRDIPPIVGSMMQIAFFVTPVIWKPEQLGAQASTGAAQPVLRPAGDRARAAAGRVAGDMTWVRGAGYSAAAVRVHLGAVRRACAAASRSGSERCQAGRIDVADRLGAVSRCITAAAAA